MRRVGIIILEMVVGFDESVSLSPGRYMDLVQMR